MGFQGPPAVDFYSQLSGLGDTIAANRAAQAKRDAFAAATTPGADGRIDYGRAILGLAQVDPQSAALFAQRQNHEDTLKQQAIDNARNATNDKFTHGISSANLAIARANLANNSEGPEEVAAQRAAAALTYGLKPGTPEHQLYSLTGKLPDSMTEGPAAAKFSTTPIFGQDTDPNSPTFGKSVIMQAGRDGSLVRSRLPEGVGLPGGSSSDSLATRATRYLDTGDDSIINRRSFGAGQQGQVQFDELQNEIERQRKTRGMRPDEISSNKIDYKAATTGAGAAARTKAVRETNLDLILRAADAAIPAALDASDKLPRTDFVPLNKLIQKGQVMTSNPELLRFGMSNLQLAEHWARAMNPTGVMRESDRDKALSFLDTAYGNGTYKQGVDQLRTQIQREKNAVNGVDADHTRINGGRPVKVSSPQDAAMYPSGTKIILPDGSPGVVP